ncbi:MAG: undecaprenyl-diphosphatase UppP [Bacillota bacterium]|nr:undecaprenyl-diphosphatase UppP [Bacillota bacterium]
MGVWEAILLGLIQGLTEFIPVSSSGHLVITQAFLGIREATLTFEVLVHFGTFLAVVVVFYKDIINIIKNPLQKLTLLIIAGAIPTGLMGIFFKDFFTGLFESELVVGIMLLVTGGILWITQKLPKGMKTDREMKVTDALFIGVLQGLAITPGISRAGTTIFAGLLRGLDREYAARFSFLLALPVIFGATLLELKDLVGEPITGDLGLAYLLGTLVAFISGYIAIKVLLKVLSDGKLYYFSYYCWLIGLTVIVRQLF